ncbi:MAG: serine/threonine protein kinase [Planctomycetaceae bacterium]|nr:serine/threonine protein kinase [Planctomycetaceae bacterium]
MTSDRYEDLSDSDQSASNQADVATQVRPLESKDDTNNGQNYRTQEIHNQAETHPIESLKDNKTLDPSISDTIYAATQIVSHYDLSKTEQDFIFASVILSENVLSERKLRKAIKDWTMHGESSLLEHLVEEELLDNERIEKIGVALERKLALVDRSRDSYAGVPRNSAAQINWLLDRLDPGGRLARVFGLRNLPRQTHGDQSRVVQNRYQFLSQLGQGGLGTVWLARDNNLNRYVAVKEIKSNDSVSSGAAARFRREAEITGHLEHPNIVPIHQFGVDDETGQVFYVMRYLGNRTLQNAITEYHEQREIGKDNPLLFHELLTAFVSVCQAIAFAHSREVIHRDLKPENIALDDFGQVVVLDWGLAKMTGLSEIEQSTHDMEKHNIDRSDMTLAGQVLGTPMYMAPEQAAGRIDEIDEKTDIYGLGAILFAILTGYAPHEESQASLCMGSQINKLFDVIVSGNLPKASELNPQVDPVLAAICEKAMSPHRYIRYQTAGQLAKDINRWMADESVSAWEEPLLVKFKRWTGQHWMLTQVIGATLTIVLMLLVTLGYVQYDAVVKAEFAAQNGLRSEGQVVSSLLQDWGRDLTNSAHFLANAPFVQDIFGSIPQPDEEVAKTEKQVLKMVCRQSLASHPFQSRVTYYRLGDGTLQEVVSAVKIHGATAQIMSKPEERLETWTIQNDHPILQRLRERKPSLNSQSVESLLVANPSSETTADANPESETAESDFRIISVSSPIFDAGTDELVGFVSIEADVDSFLHHSIVKYENYIDQVYLVDSTGNKELFYDENQGSQLHIVDDESASVNSRIDSNILSFVADHESEAGTHMTDSKVYAIRLSLDRSNEDSDLGLIFLHDDSTED